MMREIEAEQGIKIANNSFERLFPYVYVVKQSFLANNDFSQYSVKPLEGYKSWTEWYNERLSDYSVDPETMQIKNEKTPTVDFAPLKELLLSKTWTAEDEASFLDRVEKYGASFIGDSFGLKQIALSSF